MKQILYLFIISLFFITCKRTETTKCPDDVYNTYVVPDSIKAIIPYNTYDTLVFKNDSGEIDSLFGYGKTVDFVENKKSNWSGDCDILTVNNYQRITYKFKSNKNQSLNDLKYCVGYSTNTPIPEYTLIIYNFNYSSKVVEGSFEFYLNKYNHSKHFDDSIYINNVIVKGYYLDDDNDKYFLYNLKFGALKFTDELNRNWVKIK